MAASKSRNAAAASRDQALLQELLTRAKGRPVLLAGAIVISMDPDVGDFTCGDVLIEADRISAIGDDLSAVATARGAVRVDCSGLILAPGLQDTHRHAWQGQLRRFLPDDDLAGYLTKMHATMAHHYRPEDIYAGNVVSALGAIDSGVTTMLDFSHNSRSAAHSDSAIQAWIDTGLRVVHASCAPMDGDWDQQWPKDLARVQESVAQSELVTLRMGLLGKSVEIIPDLVALTAQNIALARDLGLQLSVDGFFGAEVSRQVEQLGAAGVLGPDITYIHCTDITDAAWQAIAGSGGHLSLAPTSDTQVGMVSGTPPIQKALDFGVAPSIGVDVECCLSTDMFSQMHALLTVQRMQVFARRHAGEVNPPPLLTVREVLEFATVNGAHANGLGDTTGTITPGKQADLIAVRTDDINLFPLNNAIGTLVQGADSRNIEAVFIAGRPVKWQGEVLTYDLDEARRIAYESRDFVFNAAGITVDPLA